MNFACRSLLCIALAASPACLRASEQETKAQAEQGYLNAPATQEQITTLNHEMREQNEKITALAKENEALKQLLMSQVVEIGALKANQYWFVQQINQIGANNTPILTTQTTTQQPLLVCAPG